ncbi:MAG: hypothetical protein AAB545_00025 [Patescibacteria group bacterium]
MTTGGLIPEWGAVLTQSFQSLLSGVIGFVPQIVVAIVIFLAGWVVGSLLGNGVANIIRAVKLDNALEGAGIETLLKRAGFKLDSGKFLGMLVELFVVVTFLVAALDVLHLNYVNAFLQQVVVVYIPQVIVAVLILLVAGVVADVLRKLVIGSAKAAGISSANMLGAITSWAIWIFAILTSLYQLGVAAPFVQTLFTGVVVAISIALGLSFGLGGQDAAGKFINKIRDEISE